MKIRKSVLAYFFAVWISLLAASQVQATSSIICTGLENIGGMDIVFHSGPVPKVLDVTIDFKGKRITTRTEIGAVSGSLARSFIDDHSIMIDLTDADALNLLASVRIMRSNSSNTEPLQIGFIKIAEDISFGIVCDGP